MSDIDMTGEFHSLVEAFGFGWDEIEWLTINAMKSAFWPFDQRLRIIEGQIKPGFSALRAEAL
jgi:adenosine deaminase